MFGSLSLVRSASLSLIVGLLLLSVSSASGQDRLDPVTVGTARSSMALARGLSALMTNPGGLGYLASSRFGPSEDLLISIYNGGGSIGGTYLAGDEFSQIFGGLDGGTSDDRERIGELLVDERLFANGGLNFLSATYRLPDGGGTLGLHYGSRAYARVNFPDDLANLIATSNIADQDFRFVDRGIGAVWTTEIGVAYGRVIGSQTELGWFPSIGVGGVVRLIGGVGQFNVDENSAIFIDQINVGGQLQFLVRGGYTFRSAEPDDFDQVNAVSNFLSNPFPATAGFGFGGDLGISGILFADEEHRVHYGATLANVGTITWSNKARERRGIDFRDTLGASLGDDEFERFEGRLVDVGDYSTSTPAVFRAGLGLSLGSLESGEAGHLQFGVEAEVPLNQVPGNTPDARGAVGIEWTPDEKVSARTGLGFGGLADVSLGLGVGVRPVEWLTIDVGSAEFNSLFSGDRLDIAGRVTVGFTPGRTSE